MVLDKRNIGSELIAGIGRCSVRSVLCHEQAKRDAPFLYVPWTRVITVAKADLHPCADIGVLSSLLQGGFVRPRLSKHKTSELTFTRQGIYSCTVALGLMAILPLSGVRDSKYSSWILYAIATGLSYTSATAVTGMMGAAAACCDDVEDEMDQREKLPRGKALGRFRSAVSRYDLVGFLYEGGPDKGVLCRVNWVERSDPFWLRRPTGLVVRRRRILSAPSP